MKSPEHRLDQIERQVPSEPQAAPSPPEVPNIIEFVTGGRFLNLPRLYPRQATLLKVIFLAVELFTAYDRKVLAEWGAGQGQGLEHNRQFGISSDIMERIEINRAEGRRWFREVVLAIGRRGSKGYVGALAVAYVLWCYLATWDPQSHYGIASGKVLTLQVFAMNKDQARDVFWRDLKDVISGAPCFASYLVEVRADRLTLWSPAQLAQSPGERWSPAFEIVAREATESAARGYASPVVIHDEAAHSMASGPARSTEEIYDSSLPAQTPFGVDAFTILPSSPRNMTGQFFESFKLGLNKNADGGPAHPEVLSLQLPGWELYLDWEQWDAIPLVPDGATSAPIAMAIMSEDHSDVQRVRETNPETYRVEYLAHWAEVQVAFLERAKVIPMFEPFDGRILAMQSTGTRVHEYVAHCDLSLVKDNTALVIGHCEPGVEPGRPNYILDSVEVWKPDEFEERHVVFSTVQRDLEQYLVHFEPQRLTFDSWNSASLIQNLREFAQERGLRVHIGEFSPGRSQSRQIAELFKEALYDGRIHSPAHQLALDELLFLQDLGHRIEAPTTGPVITDDVVDAMFSVIAGLTELEYDPGRLFSRVGLHAMGGPITRRDQAVFDRLGGARRRDPEYRSLKGGKTTREYRRRSK